MARILVVDDDKELLQLLGHLLRQRGHQVFVVASGFEAVDLARREHLDVVLLDIEMPGMGGMETLRRLSDVQPQVRAVLMSGYDVVCDSREASPHPACAVVAKEMPSKALIGLIDSIAPNGPAE